MAAAKKKDEKKRLPQLGVKEKPPVEDDDSLTLLTARTLEWIRRHRAQLAYGALACALGGAAFGGFLYYRMNREEKASALVFGGVAAELAPIREGNEDPEVLKRVTFYGSEDEKQKAALVSFASAKGQYGDIGVGILARLGEAGVMLDRREWDGALAAYGDVRKSLLAQADANVRMRCLEGLGYAAEGKGMLDDARRSFEELSNVGDGNAKGAKPLGLYHLARLDAQKGDKDAALNKLRAAREAVTAPGAPSSRYLKEQIEKLMARLDPANAPKPSPMTPGGMPGGAGPGGKMTKEQMDELIKRLQAGAMGSAGGAPPPPPKAPAPPGAPPGGSP